MKQKFYRASAEGVPLQPAVELDDVLPLQRLLDGLSNLSPFFDSAETALQVPAVASHSDLRKDLDGTCEGQAANCVFAEKRFDGVAGLQGVRLQRRGTQLHVQVAASVDLAAEQSDAFLKEVALLATSEASPEGKGGAACCPGEDAAEHFSRGDLALSVNTPSVSTPAGSLRLPPSLLSRLCSLSLCQLGLKRLPALAASCPLLEELFLSDNFLGDEDLRAVEHLRRLRVLRLDGNRLVFPGSRAETASHEGRRSFPGEKSAEAGVGGAGLFGVCSLLASLPSLQALDVSRNLLCGLGEQLESQTLRFLRCRDNALRELLCLHPLPALRLLDARGNDLQLIGGLENAPSLRELKLSVADSAGAAPRAERRVPFPGDQLSLLSLTHPSLQSLWIEPAAPRHPRSEGSFLGDTRLPEEGPCATFREEKTASALEALAETASQWTLPALRELRVGPHKMHAAFDFHSVCSKGALEEESGLVEGEAFLSPNSVSVEECGDEGLKLSPLSRILSEARCATLSFARSLVCLSLCETPLPRGELLTLLGCSWPSLEALDLRGCGVDSAVLRRCSTNRRLKVFLVDANPLASLDDVLESVCSEKVRLSPVSQKTRLSAENFSKLASSQRVAFVHAASCTPAPVSSRLRLQPKFLSSAAPQLARAAGRCGLPRRCHPILNRPTFRRPPLSADGRRGKSLPAAALRRGGCQGCA